MMRNLAMFVRRAGGYASIVGLMFVGSAHALDSSGTPVVVTPLASITQTASGKPITLPQKNIQVIVSTYQIAPGAQLPVHQHPFARYASVQAGTLAVTNIDTGETTTYRAGDFVVEMIGEWHRAANVGSDTVRLLVIDQVEEGRQNTILHE